MTRIGSYLPWSYYGRAQEKVLRNMWAAQVDMKLKRWEFAAGSENK